MPETHTPDLPALKARLRAEALERRDRLDAAERRALTAAICARVLALLSDNVQSGDIVSGYWPMRSEFDPRPVLQALHDRDIRLALPVVAGGRLFFRRWQPGDALVPGGFGTRVPDAAQPEFVPTVMLVPLAAFDRRGYRIGYGKGYYDGAIASCRPRLAIGVGFAAQEVAAVPAETHDERLAFVATERELIDCG